jgi:hypothetical protein
MSAIILLDADDIISIRIMTIEDCIDVAGVAFDNGLNSNDDQFSDSPCAFNTVAEADQWLQEHAQLGWCTRIIEVED